MSRLLVQVFHLFKSFGPRILFEDISLSINNGECFGLIGENGAGKTTLLRLLTETTLPDQGQVKHCPNLSIGNLPQNVTFENPNISVREYLEKGPLSHLEEQMEILLEQSDSFEEWGRIHEEYESRGGYRRLPLEQVLNGLKIDTELDVPMTSLSSGQRVRVALAKALIEEPDLLLLDEPTNHLDQKMIIWLKNTLNHRKGATVLVSHDRQFLNITCNRLIEIQDAKLVYYTGNYDDYLKEKDRILDQKIRAYENQKEKRLELKQKIRAITFSKSKPSKPSDRNIMAYDRRGEKHQKSQQRNLDYLKAQLEEIETNPLPHPKPKTITGLRFIQEPLSSSMAIELDEVSKSFNEKIVFSRVSKKIFKGDRILLTGPNGSGKTTLLRCIAQILPHESGSIRIAPSVKIAYLDQECERFPMAQTPLDYFGDHFNLSEEDLRKELHKAALGGIEFLKQKFSLLSIGQRKRLMLLSLVLEKPNVLLLDEPTNHLDLLTLEAFEKALLDFNGAILAVSHDSIFIKKIATEIWDFEEFTTNAE